MTSKEKSTASPMLVKNKHGKTVCAHLWTSFDIYPDGNVAPCCYLPGAIMGNINKQSIDEIRNSKEFKDFRKKMTTCGVKKTCQLCPVQLGMNHWEDYDIYKKLPKDSLVRKNAELNEQEIWNGDIELKSKVRKLKYTPSYKCNLNCYHCNQDQYREKKCDRLDKTTVEKVKEVMPTLQIFNPFGGEPFLFPETYEIMQSMLNINPECVLYTTTNANIFAQRTIEYLNKVKIAKIAVSLDGFSKETYEKYRVNGNWELLHKNIEILADIRKKKPFTLIFNASFNNETYKEIPVFMNICRKYDAIGKLVLLQRKSNHDNEFWGKHIRMKRKDWIEFKQLVDNELSDDSLHIDTINALKNIKKMLKRYPYSRYTIYRNNVKQFIIDTLKRVGLFHYVFNLREKILKRR
ncbi:SPASM domain-containing protein [Patescibacteria group bacterium]|nr:SPASM domain-containing protein [Patescibacteria group bacterium]MBU1722096.1 SPASM domain-containing protein [Patescibacteria group bacterium]